MSGLLLVVRHEIISLHEFFVDWFRGTADRSSLESRFLSRLHPKLTFVPPEGHVLGAADLGKSFAGAYGTNPAFNIRVRDVAVRHAMGDHVLATYTEWQTGAKRSVRRNNARFSSALVRRGEPFQWLHIQETWLPEAVWTAESFDF